MIDKGDGALIQTLGGFIISISSHQTIDNTYITLSIFTVAYASSAKSGFHQAYSPLYAYNGNLNLNNNL